MVKREICSTYTGSNTPVINTTNCVTGDGTIGSPVDLRIDPSGNIICGPNGLNVSGITANATVNTSGCIVGDGTVGNPIRAQLDPSGNIVCGANGLVVSGITGQNYASANLVADGPYSHVWNTNNLTETFSTGIRQVNHSNGADSAGSISSSITSSIFASNATFSNAVSSTAGSTTLQARSTSPAPNNITIVGSPSGTGAGTDGNPDVKFQENGNNGPNYVGFKGPLNLAQSTIMELPSDVPAIGEVMSITSITGTGTDADPFRPVLEFTASSSTVVTSGCALGDGTAGDPVRVQLDPSGGIECGPNGLFVTRECGMDVLGAVAAVDFSTGFAAKGVNISANPTVLTFTATTNCWYTLQVTNVTGTGTITWPGNVLWSGTPPQPTAGAGNISVFELWYDGTNFHGRQ